MTRRFQFSLLSLLVITTIIALSVAVLDYPRRRRVAVARILDQQKAAVFDLANEFAEILEGEGYDVTKYSTRSSGDGQWRLHVELTAERRDSREIGLIEVQGLVTHNLEGEPDWFDILPLKITCHEGVLDDRFAEFLRERLQAKKWDCAIERAR